MGMAGASGSGEIIKFAHAPLLRVINTEFVSSASYEYDIVGL